MIELTVFMRFLPKALKDFFTIDNSLLIVTFLFLIILTRFNITYFNNTNRVIAPDVNFYAGELVGHDLLYATTDQAARMVQGIPMDYGVGYGYTFTILTAWVVEILNATGICSPSHASECDFLFYKLIVTLALFGLLSLVFVLIKDRSKRSIGFLFLTAFLLGVPGGMGIESGNLDILLTCIFGYMLLLQKRSLSFNNGLFYPIILGILSGLLIQTKLFFLPIALIFLLCSKKPLTFFLSLLLMFGLITIAPGLYNAPINPLYTFEAAGHLRSATALSEGIVYGNNSTRAMIGGIVFEIPILASNSNLRSILINVGGVLLFLGILLTPLYSFRKKLIEKFKANILSDRLSYPFFIVLCCYGVTAMVLWPEVSLGYRMYYLLPLFFVLIDMASTPNTKRSIGLGISALLTRSFFLWHTRILHLFLLFNFYFLLTGSLAVWLETEKIPSKKRKTLKAN